MPERIEGPFNYTIFDPPTTDPEELKRREYFKQRNKVIELRERAKYATTPEAKAAAKAEISQAERAMGSFAFSPTRERSLPPDAAVSAAGKISLDKSLANQKPAAPTLEMFNQDLPQAPQGPPSFFDMDRAKEMFGQFMAEIGATRPATGERSQATRDRIAEVLGNLSSQEQPLEIGDDERNQRRLLGALLGASQALAGGGGVGAVLGGAASGLLGANQEITDQLRQDTAERNSRAKELALTGLSLNLQADQLEQAEDRLALQEQQGNIQATLQYMNQFGPRAQAEMALNALQIQGAQLDQVLTSAKIQTEMYKARFGQAGNLRVQIGALEGKLQDFHPALQNPARAAVYTQNFGINDPLLRALTEQALETPDPATGITLRDSLSADPYDTQGKGKQKLDAAVQQLLVRFYAQNPGLTAQVLGQAPALSGGQNNLGNTTVPTVDPTRALGY